uniref:Globin domain-containing protein n=1 Tax=Salmo trutta TaxID=8032 RepID=A0A673W4U9_SALTR
MRFSTRWSRSVSLCLIVYPWTQRYFGTFGDLKQRSGYPVQNMDDIKNTYVELSVLHSEKLHVDPDNFRVRFWMLGDCLTIVLACQMGRAFTPDVQAALQKFLTVVVSVPDRQYC